MKNLGNSFITCHYHFREIDSTNSKAVELAAANAQHGTLITADLQTKGRGQRSRTWFSPEKKGLYYSIILRPELPEDKISVITLMAGIVVYETIKKELGLQPDLKWPNDVLVSGKKVAGILTECSWNNSKLSYAVIGIGINVVFQHHDFPKSLVFPATALNLESSVNISTDKLAETLSENFEKWYSALKETSSKEIIEQWSQRTTIFGRNISIETSQGGFTGKALRLDTNGFIVVKTQQIGSKAFGSGTVRYLSENKHTA